MSAILNLDFKKVPNPSPPQKKKQVSFQMVCLAVISDKKTPHLYF